MKDTTLHDLCQFVKENAHKLSAYEGGTNWPTTLPSFDLYARDYLGFAEEELEEYQSETQVINREKHLINCISHLKRAMDCELDMFMGAFGLLESFQKRNLKFKKKLDFLEKAGVFTSRTLERLNTIRNKMEHKYEIPKLNELEIYFDLVASFIAVLERTIMFSQYSESTFFDWIDEDEHESKIKMGMWVRVRYHTGRYPLLLDKPSDKPYIKISWGTGGDELGWSTCDLDEPIKFAFLFRVFILLFQSERFISSRYVIRGLDTEFC